MSEAIRQIQCPSCGHIYKIDAAMVGRKVRCRCGHAFRASETVLLGASAGIHTVPEALPRDALVDESSPPPPPGPPPRGKPSTEAPPGRNPSGFDDLAPAEVEPTPKIDLSGDDMARVEMLHAAYEQMAEMLSRVIVGQRRVMEEVLIAIFCRGHTLLVGVPGLAKTLLVSTIARVLDLSFKRIQFTPDLMPSDITGTDVLQEDHTTGKRVFRFVEGPVFANMVLADEINRTPPKTQAALLEAMQERHVTIGDQTYGLPAPFFVMATQNPIEQEGTYPLPEAQLDRFLFNTLVDYPDKAEEFDIIRQASGDYEPKLDVLLTAEQIVELQAVVRRIPVADHVIAYARDLARATRPRQEEAPDFIREMVAWGAGPRAGISLILAAKARAVLYGRYHATTEDVRAMALPVLRHRVMTTFNAEAAGVTSDQIVENLLQQIRPNVRTGV
jgi:MoxR-like ATPase